MRTLMVTLVSTDVMCKQGCIPVGCVPPTLYHTGGGLCPGGILCQGDPSPMDRQTPVKVLPCLKLRLRAVKSFQSL